MAPTAITTNGNLIKLGMINREERGGDRVDVPSKRVAYFKLRKEATELLNREPARPEPPPLSEAGRRRTAIPSSAVGVTGRDSPEHARASLVSWVKQRLSALVAERLASTTNLFENLLG